MNRRLHVLWLVWAAACSPGANSDASIDASDVSSERSRNDAESIDAAVGPDSVDAPMALDALAGDSGCVDFSGAFNLAGLCVPLNTPDFFIDMCVNQTGCSVTLSAAESVYTGTAAGMRATVMNTDPSLGVCTLTATSSAYSLACTVPEFAASCSASATPLTVAGVSRFCCDITRQDCAVGERCTLVAPNNDLLVPACLPLMGNATEGMPCVRSMGEVGFDPCVGGLYCANSGLPSLMTRECRGLCTTGSDCATGFACLQLGAVGIAGICVPTCTFGGSDCAAGTTCRYEVALDPSDNPVFVGMCGPIGSASNGAACSVESDCVTEQTCVNGMCEPICDAANPCGSGQVCSPDGTPGVVNNPQEGTCQ